MDSIYILAEEMKILIDENIPYVEHFFHDYLDDIEYFKDKEFEINMVKNMVRGYIKMIFRLLALFLQNISPHGATATRIRPYFTILQFGWGTNS